MPNDSSPSNMPDQELLNQNLARIDELTKRLVAALGNQQGHSPKLDSPDQQFYAKAAAAYFAEMMSDPSRIIQAQVGFWSESLKNWSDAQNKMLQGEDAASDEPSKDRRFKNEKWNSDPYFNLIKRQYLLSSKTITDITGDMKHLRDKDREKVDFFAKQIVDFYSPTNFLGTNPDALDKAVETNGQSLVDGLENLVRDIESNSQGISTALADPDAFVVGKDIATTPGSVVFENRMFQLIQYAPTTEKVFHKPLLIAPPWINKFYILDLRPENSLIRYAVEQGHTVFVISWVNPDASYADAGLDTYLNEGMLTAIDTVLEITGEDSVNVAGYCIGGTLLACALAYLTAKNDVAKVNKATFFTTMTDFSEPGELGAFLEDGFLEGLVEQVKNTGYLDSFFMSRTFSYLRANDLIYAPAVRSYMLGEAPPAFDLLQWNSDSTNLPGSMAVEYLQKLYVENQLAKGEFELMGEKIRLAEIDVPIYAISTIQDHIAPWKSTFKGLAKTRGERTFLLSESGHIAGIVNPASKNKYGHWHNEEPPRDPDFWLENATFVQESWWHRWNAWLAKDEPKDAAARQPGTTKFPVIEPAPGRYVIKNK